MSDLLIIAEAQIAEKQYKEIENIKKRLDADKEIIKQAIELVQSHTLYKVESYRNYSHKYILATEEMLKEDYLKEPKYTWQKGIQFKAGDSSKSWNTGILNVNGETYYDIHFALEHFERRINEKEYEIEHLTDKIKEIKESISRMEDSYPSLKQAIVEWQEYQEKMKENEQMD